jgi:hypothetical protein
MEKGNMKFITNKIQTGKAKTLAELLAKKEEAPVVKTAAAQAEVKVAEEKKEKDEGQSSGQLDVEPLHQKGESTPTPGKKEEKAAGGEVKDTNNENTKPAESSGQPEWEGKKENVNDPKAGEHREGDGDQKKSEAAQPVKEAAKKCEKCGKEPCACEKKEASRGNIDNLTAPRFGKDGKPEEKKDDKAEDKKDCKDCKAEEKTDTKAAEAKPAETKTAQKDQFVKVSNLNAKDKSWLRTYWRNLYPAEYADAMTADK